MPLTTIASLLPDLPKKLATSLKNDVSICTERDYESIDEFENGQDRPYLRTSSHSDIFANIDTTISGSNGLSGQTKIKSENSMASMDWMKMGECEISMDQSHSSTLVSQCCEQVKEGKSPWPFVFDPEFKQQRQDMTRQVTVSPTDVVGKEENRLSSPGTNDLIVPYEDVYASMRTNRTELYPPLSVKSESVLETINMLGRNSFSDSFVERLIEQSKTQIDELGNGNIIPSSYYSLPNIMDLPPMVGNFSNQTFLPQYPWQQNPNNTSQYWSASACPITNSTSDNHLPPSNHSSNLTLKSTKRNANTKTSTDTVINRRKTMQHSILCQLCHHDLGIAFIRGAYYPDTEATSPVQAFCVNCHVVESSEQDGIGIVAGDSKKRKRREQRIIECEVCHCKIGNGGLYSKISNSDVKVEFVCSDCGNKYMFCSECGGGGKQRTGKWRPRELFEQGRRTCSLPHIRVGTAELHYKVIRVQDLSAEVLQGIQDVFFDCLLSLYCVPTIMTHHKFGSFETVKKEIEKLWLTSILDVISNNVLFGQKYVTVAWIHKRHRNKGVGRSNPAKESTPWLQRLGLSGIIAPPKYSADSDEKHHCFVAFSIAEWDAIGQTIFLAQMAPRSVFLKTMEGYIDLIRNCIEQVQNDAKKANVIPPKHIWCWAKADHARLQSIPTRLKFVTKADYLQSHPYLTSSQFERPSYHPLQGEGTVVYATSIDTFSHFK